MTETTQPRPTAFDLINTQAVQAAEALVAANPSLDGVAIVFSYEARTTELPVAIIRTPNGGLRGPTQYIKMLEQLQRTFQQISTQAHQEIVNLDRMMAEKAMQLQGLEEKIKNAEQQLESSGGEGSGNSTG